MPAWITTGDDIRLPVTLKKDGATFAIDSGATILANFRDSRSDLLMLASDVAVLEAAPGSDWPNSLIVVDIPEASSLLLSPDPAAKMEVQVDDSTNAAGKLTWFITIEIKRGRIP